MASDSTAIAWFAVERDSKARGGGSRWGSLAAGLLIGALLGSAVTALGGAILERAPVPAAQASVREWPDHPLEPEWRWSGRAYDIERMFRRPRSNSR